MEAIVACCAGLDVHQAGVVACLNRGGKRGGKEIRSFGTTRGELAEMCAWLRAGGCTLVAMESTGVYWHPVYFALEGQFELIVGNAQHIKNVPGRKTDVKDCDWISDLARHGLIAKSFVPPKPIRELRWYRKFGQWLKLGSLLRRTDLDDEQTEAVFGGVQGEGRA
jgi:transposase